MTAIQKKAAFAVTAGLIAALLYLPMLQADFTADARAVVLTNDYVHHLGNLAEVMTFRVMRRDVVDNNRPFYLASVLLDWGLWGANPAGHHFTNILLHAMATALLFLFCLRLLEADSPVEAGGGVPGRKGKRRRQKAAMYNGNANAWIALSVSVLFAVHPIQTEAVAEVSYRKDLIAAIGLLGTLYLATFFEPVFSSRNFWIGFGCVACALAATATKENGAATAPSLFCYWFLFRRGKAIGGTRGWAILCGAVFTVIILFMAARFLLPPPISHVFTDKPQYPGGSLAAALAIQPRIWAFYFRQILFPQGLDADYTAYNIRNFSTGVSVAALVLVLAAQVFLATRSRLFAMGAAIFWLALLPASNLLPLYRPIADRFLYVPMTGAALMLASARFKRAGWLVAAGAAALVLAVLTFQREKVWHDSLSLWSDAWEKNPASYAAADNLSYAWLDAGNPEAAVAPAEAAIRLSSGRDADPYAALAVALDELGRKADAGAAYKKAVDLDRRYADPESLVTALVYEEPMAAKLEKLSQRDKPESENQK